ncbi:hypothetical protein [Alkaliphilus transvaalensis]|uniref:hypothetical protein n=1 Tax=Alkaliphilus transvaalensis TaxID=114628 RepID=UPI00047EDA6F|nr:hypothetical protein [Alkaliphilus transvaalensis]
MNNKKVPLLSIILYGIASFLGLYTAWGLYHTHDYISNMIADNLLIVKGNEYDIVNFYMTSSGQYLLFATILFVLGRIIHLGSKGKLINFEGPNGKLMLEEISKGDIADDDFEDWFHNHKE